MRRRNRLTGSSTPPSRRLRPLVWAAALSLVAVLGASPAMAGSTPAVVAGPEDVGVGDSITSEGDTGTTEMTFAVSLGIPGGDTTYVQWSTSDATAEAGVDYVAASGLLLIPVGQFSGVITVLADGDTDVELDETYHLDYEEIFPKGRPDVARVEPLAGTATGTILNDDVAPSSADLGVTAAVSPDPVVVGHDLTYEITVTNPSVTVAAAGVELATVLESQLVIVSAVPTQGSCAGSAPLACVLGAIPPESDASVTIVARTTRTTGELFMQTTVTATTPDDDDVNNAAYAPTSVDEDEFGCTIVGSNAAETIVGTGFDDVICGRGGNDVISGGEGDDELRGGAGDDTLLGQEGNDLLIGFVGWDTFYGSSGDDVFDGGGGWDNAVYSNDPDGISVDLRAGSGVDGFGGTDTFSSVGAVLGSAYGDTLGGSRRPNTLDGAAGDDTISGRGANDNLIGGDGTDSVNGNQGADICTGEVVTNCEA